MADRPSAPGFDFGGSDYVPVGDLNAAVDAAYAEAVANAGSGGPGGGPGNAAPPYVPGVITPDQPVPPVIEPGIPPKPPLEPPVIEPPGSLRPSPPVPYQPPPADIPRGPSLPPGGGVLFPGVIVPGLYGIFTEDWPVRGLGGGELNPYELYPINPITMPQPLPPVPPPVVFREIPPIYPEPVDTGGARRVTERDLFPPGMRDLPPSGYYDLQPISVEARRIKGFDYGSVLQPFPAPPAAPGKSRRQRVRQAGKAIISGQLSNLWPFVGAITGLIGATRGSRSPTVNVAAPMPLTPPVIAPEPTSPAPAPVTSPPPLVLVAGGSGFGGTVATADTCDCSQCKSKRKKPRKCLQKAPLRWAGGPKKGKAAGTRCVRFAT